MYNCTTEQLLCQALEAELKVNATLLDIVTLFTQSSQSDQKSGKTSDGKNRPTGGANVYKYFNIIKGYGESLKLISLKSQPRKRLKSKAEWKSYDKKLWNSISRTKAKIYELAICNDWQYFVTFTINKEHYDRYNLKEYMSAFGKWLSNYSARKTGGKKIEYILIPEMHKDGAWHLHGLMRGIPAEHLTLFESGKHPKHLIDNAYLNWGAYEKKFGFCSLDKIKDKERVAKYITKYISKTLATQGRELHSQLYYCTKGLNMSEEIFRGWCNVAEEEFDFQNEYVGLKWFSPKEEEHRAGQGQKV